MSATAKEEKEIRPLLFSAFPFLSRPPYPFRSFYGGFFPHFPYFLEFLAEAAVAASSSLNRKMFFNCL